MKKIKYFKFVRVELGLKFDEMKLLEAFQVMVLHKDF
jgi:hypothetical protein